MGQAQCVKPQTQTGGRSVGIEHPEVCLGGESHKEVVERIVLTDCVDSHKDVRDKTSMGVPQSFAHMKRIAVSAGLVALSATVMQAGPSANLNSMQASKAWSMSASLRGFYDSNYLLANTGAQNSYGFTVAPTLSVNLPGEQTLFSASYTYSLIYYQDRQDNGQDSIDQTHQFDMSLIHAFSERYTAEIRDSFVVAQEPSLLDSSNNSYPGRANGDNIHNVGVVRFSAELTRLTSLVLAYENSFYDYQQDNNNETKAQSAADPSRTGLLDRISQTVGAELHWQAARNTVGILGYKFGWVDFTGDEAIAQDSITGHYYKSDSRNNYSHYGYVGADHNFNQALSGSVRVGAQYTEYYNNYPNSTHELGPYAESSLSYNYTKGGYAQLGARHARNSTDVVQTGSNGKITQDQASTVVYGNISHQLTPKLRGSVLGSVQWSQFNGGSANNDVDTFYNAGLNLEYVINQHLSAECGYSYDTLVSDISGRGYERNHVYLGVTAAY
jgi:hypothetical protein